MIKHSNVEVTAGSEMQVGAPESIFGVLIKQYNVIDYQLKAIKGLGSDNPKCDIEGVGV